MRNKQNYLRLKYTKTCAYNKDIEVEFCRYSGGKMRNKCGEKICGAKGIRTPDLLNAIQTLSQLSYSPKIKVQSYEV